VSFRGWTVKRLPSGVLQCAGCGRRGWEWHLR
jgi:hypothetical protein